VDELKLSGKPFDISRQEVWEAYLKVKANKGAPGVDEVSLAEFGADLKNNLYKIWNRMSSGSYFPPPVKAVEIPKADGGVRVLGVPAVGDRIAQTVAARHLEARVEPVFHPDSYGYRPGRGALDAVAACRRRCWKYDWAIDLDVRKFFDSVPWDLIVKAVEHHTDARWVVLYVKRWLAAPLVLPDGTVQQRDRGTPQGSAVSPVLANLFMHYAFDLWLARNHPEAEFERYADDAVIHCRSLQQAKDVLAALEGRMAEVGLRLHPDKTRIVYCKDANRKLGYANTQFTFLGYTFRARTARGRGGTLFASFQARHQQAGPEEDQRGSPLLAAAPLVACHLERYRAVRQSQGRRLAGVLRGVLPLGALPGPAAHQRLPGALDAAEVQTAAIEEESPGHVVADRHRLPQVPCPLEVDGQPLADRMTGAR